MDPKVPLSIGEAAGKLHLLQTENLHYSPCSCAWEAVSRPGPSDPRCVELRQTLADIEQTILDAFANLLVLEAAADE